VTEPIWLPVELVIAIHERQLREFGGPPGLRDLGLLESALGRAKNLWTYEAGDLAALAAAYGFGIARNHPFVDGNKRTALVVLELALMLNGYELKASDTECVATMLALAAGQLAETDLADWIGKHLEPPIR